jgi:hypothetical protein
MHGWRNLDVKVWFKVEDMDDEWVTLTINPIHSHHAYFLMILLILKEVRWFIWIIIYIKAHEANSVFFGANRINWRPFKSRINSWLSLLKEAFAVHLLIVFSSFKQSSSCAILIDLNHRFLLTFCDQLHQLLLELKGVINVLDLFYENWHFFICVLHFNILSIF